MENKIQTKIQAQIQHLRQFEKERKLWMALSLVVLISVVGIIFDWHLISRHHLSWLVGAGGLLMSIAWWYWTMRITKELLTIKIQDRHLLQEVIDDVKHIRTEILKTLPNRD
jgi:protein-S-isoprenylcysteine O-methyltransferase Ste14